jgi:hypothetical protein
MRAHIVLPDDLIEEIDALAGPRKRSQFIEEAVRAKLVNERQKRAMAALMASGGLKEVPPEWSTPAKTSEWVHNMRMEDLNRPSPWDRYKRD